MSILPQHLSVICPRCGEPQILLASELAKGQLAHCSSCTEPLGRWRDLALHAPDSKVA